MSFRKAINAHCRWCCVDPADKGSSAQQIAVCQMTDCPLYSLRPITCTKLPMKLLTHWGISPDRLDSRAKTLVVDSEPGRCPISPPTEENEQRTTHETS